MTLMNDRPEASALDRPEALTNPQSHALEHLSTTAMRAPPARPAKRDVHAAWRRVQGS
jgi:hypothetical protein